MDTLSFIILCPLVGAVLIALIPRNFRVLFRAIALATTGLSLIGALRVFIGFELGTARIQYQEIIPWVYSLGISYHLGVDGLNVGLILMGALVAFAAVCVSAEITEREKEFYLLLLLMTGGILGAFASLDLFFFYCFHELALVPTFIMIGVWGRGVNRREAAFNITLYLSLGALLALVGLIALYLETGGRTFNLVTLTRQVAAHPVSEAAQQVIFPLLMFGFGILVSLWPFHTWAPLGYGAAPTATAMVHAGVIKKFGLYGLLRIAVPLLPEGAQRWVSLLALLCLGNLLYGGLVAMRQKNFNLLLANSSVAHMGFAFLGIASLSLVGVTGAVVVMVAHGLLAALTFGLSGYLHQRLGTLELEQMGGLLRRLPFVGGVLVMAMLAGCGLPGFANFPGEVLVLFGSWSAYPAAVSLAAWAGLIIGAVYALRAVRLMLHGALPDRWTVLPDAASAWRRLPYALLLAALVVFGCFPRLLTDRVAASAQAIVEAVHGTALANETSDPGGLPDHQPPRAGAASVLTSAQRNRSQPSEEASARQESRVHPRGRLMGSDLFASELPSEHEPRAAVNRRTPSASRPRSRRAKGRSLWSARASAPLSVSGCRGSILFASELPSEHELVPPAFQPASTPTRKSAVRGRFRGSGPLPRELPSGDELQLQTGRATAGVLLGAIPVPDGADGVRRPPLRLGDISAGLLVRAEAAAHE
jgi:NADH-quinone oxidoreductase subunit M